jgi:hypothetical protein
MFAKLHTINSYAILIRLCDRRPRFADVLSLSFSQAGGLGQMSFKVTDDSEFLAIVDPDAEDSSTPNGRRTPFRSTSGEMRDRWRRSSLTSRCRRRTSEDRS